MTLIDNNLLKNVNGKEKNKLLDIHMKKKRKQMIERKGSKNTIKLTLKLNEIKARILKVANWFFKPLLGR